MHSALNDHPHPSRRFGAAGNSYGGVEQATQALPAGTWRWGLAACSPAEVFLHERGDAAAEVDDRARPPRLLRRKHDQV